MPEIVDTFPDLPVVTSGGIADGHGLAAALMLEAEGVPIGTRFYASQEAKGHPEAKQRTIQAGRDDTRRSIVFHVSRRNIWPQPYTGGAIRNPPLPGCGWTWVAPSTASFCLQFVFFAPVASTCSGPSSAHSLGQLSVGWLRWSVAAS